MWDFGRIRTTDTTMHAQAGSVVGVNTYYSPSNPDFKVNQQIWFPDPGVLPREVSSCIDSTNRKVHGKYASGGLLQICKDHVKCDTVDQSWDFPDPSAPMYRYKGNASAWAYCPQRFHDDAKVHSSFKELPGLGATAWNRFKPGKSAADLMQFLVEFRDVPRTLRDTVATFKSLKRGLPSKKQLGNDYLTYQFGWMPVVRDLRKFYKAYVGFDKALANAIKFNGKWQRRGGTLSEASEELSKFGGNDCFITNMPPWTDVGTMSYSGTSRYTEKIWFEGLFRYYVPQPVITSPQFSNQFKAHLFGLEVTPALIWELTPWSWLIDYFANVGDVLSNLTDGPLGDVVAKYAYLMCTSQVSTSCSSSFTACDGAAYSGTAVWLTERKTRIPASRYGFGLSAELSASQLAIIGALGLGRFG